MLETLSYEFRDGNWVPVAKLVRCLCGVLEWVLTPEEAKRRRRISDYEPRALNYYVQASMAEIIYHRPPMDVSPKGVQWLGSLKKK